MAHDRQAPDTPGLTDAEVQRMSAPSARAQMLSPEDVKALNEVFTLGPDEDPAQLMITVSYDGIQLPEGRWAVEVVEFTGHGSETITGVGPTLAAAVERLA